MSRPEKNAGGQPSVDTEKAVCFEADYDVAKAWSQAGREVRLIDVEPEDRPKLLGILATLRDELPAREQHASETRLRAQRYWLPGEFLRHEVAHA
jgi:hypothetical protein